jgi:hypothetical protein
VRNIGIAQIRTPFRSPRANDIGCLACAAFKRGPQAARTPDDAVLGNGDEEADAGRAAQTATSALM